MADRWKGQTATLTITDDSDSDVPIGVLQDVEISKESETAELYGSGSVKRQDVAQTEVSVTVSGTVAAWDIETWKSLIGYDDTNDEIEDTATLPTFQVDMEATATGTDTADTIRVTNVYFESVPISGSYDDYLELDLDGTGDDAIVNPA